MQTKSTSNPSLIFLGDGMDYETFLAKVNGKEKKDESSYSKTSSLGEQQHESIVRTAREYGWWLDGLEARPEFPSGIELAWERGVHGHQMGLHGYPSDYRGHLSSIHAAGLRHSRSEQQGGVPSEAEPVGQPEGVATSRRARESTVEWVDRESSVRRYYIDTDGDICFGSQPIQNGEYYSGTFRPVGSTSTNTLSREEPSGGGHHSTHTDDAARYLAGVRPSLSEQERRVQSVRDERESRERSVQDTLESLRRSLERSSRW